MKRKLNSVLLEDGDREDLRNVSNALSAPRRIKPYSVQLGKIHEVLYHSAGYQPEENHY
jgi:hypothetical protein